MSAVFSAETNRPSKALALWRAALFCVNNLSLLRGVSLALAAFVFYVPINWLILGLQGGLAKPDPTGWPQWAQMAVGTCVFWAAAALIAFLTFLATKRAVASAERRRLELDALYARPLQPMTVRKAMLKPGEVAYGVAMGDYYQSQTVGYKGGTQGMSVRVAKGMTLRTSATRGQPVKGLVKLASGELVVTNQRIIFAGDQKSFAIALDNLINSSNYTDGFSFNDSKSSYTVKMPNGRARVEFEVALYKVLHPEVAQALAAGAEALAAKV